MNEHVTIIQEIVNLVERDEIIDHLRINIVNGCGDVFMKYKRNLKSLEDNPFVSVALYKNTDDLQNDLISHPTFGESNWFNLFVFNLNYCKHICIKEDCYYYNQIALTCDEPTYCIDAMCLDSDDTVEEQLMREILGIESITKELRSKLDYKFYDTVMVSMLNKNVILEAFEKFVGKECPVKSMRYKGFDFTSEDILKYIHGILRTHSSEFLYKWNNAVKKLENLSLEKKIV